MQIHKGFTIMIALIVMIVIGVFFLQSSERKGESAERSSLLAVQTQAKILLESSIISAQRLAKEDNSTNSTRQMTMVLKNNGCDYSVTTSWHYVWCSQQECFQEAINVEGNITKGAMIESEVKSLQFPVRAYKKTLIMW